MSQQRSIPLTRQQRSAVFSRYNRMRHQADSGRANRALGLVQRGAERPYHTTARACTCPDWQYRIQYVAGGKCKHQLQLELESVADTVHVDSIGEINADLFD